MGTALIAFASAFALVLAVELPDKTLVATLILTTRYRPWPVFLGVSAAFAVQCVIAAAFGGVLTLLPDQVVAAVVALLFALGAFFLLKEGFSKQEEDETEDTAANPTVSFRRAALTSFGVLFAAEWGDASQIATAGLTAKYAEPIWVGLGAWLALVTVAGIAVLVGSKIAARIKPHLIQRVAGVVFAAFALLALYEAIWG
ncbi:TMEM165/GDT1 family protein [Actinokineospora sp. NBRC 105648]|uniref:TMEM165/GDT1 family protein n=1 Tax=Actinokineospora sp. NBRC 105648 TaxID=3032206 RepID=UPI0025559C1E|nr:TMEM165/GDT1 family protein [Actinokineospora sp. NBRC 105648]